MIPQNGLPAEWLMLRLSSLGDVVLTTGVIRYFSELYGVSFSVMTRPAFAPVFKNNPFVKEVIAPRPQDLSFPSSLAFFRRVAASHKGSLLLDLHGSLRSRMLGFLWRGPVRRYPKFSAERREFLKSGSKELSALLLEHPVTQRYVMALEESPPPRDKLLPELYLGEDEKNAARKRLSDIFGNGGRPLLALHPFATHILKAWPRAHWLEFINMLESAGIDWIIVGQGDELQAGDKRDLTGKTSLRELAALLGEAALLVTGDSGPMHLAGAVGTPVLAMFGPTTAEWGFSPAGPRDVVLELPLDCRPCSLHGAGKGAACASCGGRCLGDISPQMVFDKARASLSGLIV